MDPRIEANRANWNERVPIHVASEFYDVEGWLREASGPSAEESNALGDVEGKTLVHLQCHFGMDTLRWARAGAVVTGLDFSPAAIEQATLLAARAGLSERSTFVCSNVYDAGQTLEGRHYDVVYVSLGSLCWLPDVHAWAAIVAGLLRPGGRLYLHDVHPLAATLDDDGHCIEFDYFSEPDKALAFDFDRTYTDGATLHSTKTFEWIHSLGDIVGGLLANGLALESLQEHEWTEFQQFPWLGRTTLDRYIIPEGSTRIPLSFTIVARQED